MWAAKSQTCSMLPSSLDHSTYLSPPSVSQPSPQMPLSKLFFLSFFFCSSARHPDKKWIAVLSRPSKQASCLWRYRWVWYKMLFNPETTPRPPGRPIPHAAHPSCRAIEWTGYRAPPGEGRAEREKTEEERGGRGCQLFAPVNVGGGNNRPAYHISPLKVFNF